VKENGGSIVCECDGDFIATVLKTAIAAVFPGSFKQSITMLLKCKLGDQNVSDHGAIQSSRRAATGNSMLEGFKLAGAIVAFVIALFTVWNRWARGRPLAWVTAEKFGANPLEYIRIKNPAPATCSFWVCAPIRRRSTALAEIAQVQRLRTPFHSSSM
jgi:hypothetical protein